MTQAIPVIGEEERFYGYITGLGVERSSGLCDEPVPTRLYATFEYGATTTVWLVPDHELFAILGRYLAEMAEMRHEHDDYGYSKLWIGRKGGRWNVFLP